MLSIRIRVFLVSIIKIELVLYLILRKMELRLLILLSMMDMEGRIVVISLLKIYISLYSIRSIFQRNPGKLS